MKYTPTVGQPEVHNPSLLQRGVGLLLGVEEGLLVWNHQVKGRVRNRQVRIQSRKWEGEGQGSLRQPVDKLDCKIQQ